MPVEHLCAITQQIDAGIAGLAPFGSAQGCLMVINLDNQKTNTLEIENEQNVGLSVYS